MSTPIPTREHRAVAWRLLWAALLKPLPDEDSGLQVESEQTDDEEAAQAAA